MDDVSAPTLWEEGRWSARRVTRFSLFALVLLVAADLIVSGGLGVVFDSGFVILCVGIALAVRPEEFFRVGVLPPMLLLGLFSVLAVVHRDAIAPAGDGLIQSLISALAHHSGSLFVGYALCLVVLAIRQRVLARIAATGAATEVDAPAAHSNRAASPEPYRVTSGEPDVKSTTVVGNDPDSPAMTASNS